MPGPQRFAVLARGRAGSCVVHYDTSEAALAPYVDAARRRGDEIEYQGPQGHYPAPDASDLTMRVHARIRDERARGDRREGR